MSGKVLKPGHSAPYVSILIEKCLLVKFLFLKMSSKDIYTLLPRLLWLLSPMQVKEKKVFWLVEHIGLVVFVQSYWKFGIGKAVIS